MSPCPDCARPQGRRGVPTLRDDGAKRRRRAGSWIAMVPILLIVPFMVCRTLIEERMLADALPGYADYMRRVRSRIVPSVW